MSSCDLDLSLDSIFYVVSGLFRVDVIPCSPVNIVHFLSSLGKFDPVIMRN